MRRNVEVLHPDVQLGHLIDRAAPEGGNPLRPRVALVGGNPGHQVGLLVVTQVGHLIPLAEDHIPAHRRGDLSTR